MTDRPWWREPLLIADFIPPDADAMAQRDMGSLAKMTADLGFNAVHHETTSVVEGEAGIFFFQSEAAREVRADLLGPYCAEAHGRGLRIFIYFDVHWYDAAFTADHSEWAQRSREGEPIVAGYGVGHYACVNSPWREWSFQVIRDLAGYDIDGIFLDGPFVAEGGCYCEACRGAFGEPMPRFGDWGDPRWREFVEFRHQSMARYLGEAREALKSVRPQALLYMNGNGLNPTWVIARDNRRLAEFQDLLGAEGGFLSGDLRRVPLWKASATAKLLETQAEGKPTVVFIAGRHGPWSRFLLTQPELRLLHYTALANGANTWYGIYESVAGTAPVSAVRQVNGFVQEHAEYFRDTESAANIALLWSGTTADRYGADVEESDFTAGRRAEAGAARGNFGDAFHGWYEALLRSHLAFDVVDEPALGAERLARYGLLILPNCACLPEGAAAAIREWVANGGNLMATYDTSLYDEAGGMRSDFALGDVLGVRFAGRFIGPLRFDHLPVDREHLLFQGIEQPLIPAPGLGIAVEATTARPVTHFLEAQRSRYQELPPQSADPAIMMNRFDEGKVLYLAGTFGAAYHTYALPEHQALLGNAARRLAEPLLSLEGAPECLEVTLRRQPEHDRLLVHLINFTGEMTRPLRRVLPTRNLHVILHRVPKAQRVTGLVHRQELGWHRADEGIRIAVPTMGEYEVVVVQL